MGGIAQIYAPDVYSKSKADEIYDISQKHIATMPKNKFTHELITIAVSQLNEIAESQADILRAMKQIARSMPEYPVVIAMAGVGENLAAQKFLKVYYAKVKEYISQINS